MYISTGDLVAIILMTIGLTWFLVAATYTWTNYEAKLMVDRLEDENHELRQELNSANQHALVQDFMSYDATELASYQMMCGPVVTMFAGKLAIVENDRVFPYVDVSARQFKAGCERPLECQAFARGQLSFFDDDPMSTVEWDSIVEGTIHKD